MLGQIAAAAFSGRMHCEGKTEEIEKRASGYGMISALPFAKKRQVKLNQKGDELILRWAVTSESVFAANAFEPAGEHRKARRWPTKDFPACKVP